MSRLFSFGEEVYGYDYKVINERDARASAGIMFLLGILSLFSLFMFRTLFWAEVFSITFIIEFFIRVVINPKYAPYMVLGSIIVSNQQPEWVEAKPKKFAWILGLGLGFIMAYFIVNNIMSPARLLVCLLCLVLLYMESVFGICLGCLLYKRLNIKVENCPGGVCDTTPKHAANLGKKFFLVFLYMLLFGSIYYFLKTYKYDGGTSMQVGMSQEQRDLKEFEDDDMEQTGQTDVPMNEQNTATPSKGASPKNKDCTPPEWAIKMGHREMWLEHHGCK